MSLVCPQCSHVNPDATAFCTRCGYHFQVNEQITNDEATARSANLASLPPNADPSATLKPGSQPTPSMPQPQPQPQTFAANAPSFAQPTASPASPSYAPTMAAPDPNQPQGGYMMPLPPQQGGYPMPPAYGQNPYSPPPIIMPNTGTGMAVLQRAFAGKGTPVHHQSWLLDNNQAQPAALHNSLVENVHRQGVMGVSATPERLREQSTIMEDRDYIKVQYGVSSVFVYMAPMGQSLYISRTSTVQQPFSRTRIFVLSGLALLMVICFILYAVINPTYDQLINGQGGAYSFVEGIKTFFFYASYGLLFFFLFLVLRSLVLWLTEKDFLTYLRPNKLNDFTLDALSSVEHITDKGLRETLRQAGLNAEAVTSSTLSHTPGQPLHRI